MALFESRRRAKEEQEKDSREAVDRGWALVSGYRLELIDDLFEVYGVQGDGEPYEYTQIEVDLREETNRDEYDELISTDPVTPVPPAVAGRHTEEAVFEEPFPPLAPDPPVRISRDQARPEEVSTPATEVTALDTAQRRVVEMLHLASTGWFGFFFRTLGGNDFERREVASRHLTEASRTLTKISKDLAGADDLPPQLFEVSGRFRTAIEGWADAFDAIGRGMMLDQQHVANRGLELMQEATESAEAAGMWIQSADLEATKAFQYLIELDPPEGASRSAARRAKEPWRRAIKAASSAPKARRSRLDRRG